MRNLLLNTKYLILTTLLFLLGCSSAPATGSLAIYANGEDFVRDGFTSVDGWDINFDHLYVNIKNINAFQSETGYDASVGGDPFSNTKSVSSVSGDFLVDLTQDRSTGEPVLIHTITSVEAGHFNSVLWEMSSNDYPAYQLIGTASKDGETITFDISITENQSFACGEFVGDERKGFVNADETGELELTFHLDHIFGDADSEMTSKINEGALGFQPLADIAENGTLTVTSSDLATLFSTDDYDTFNYTIANLGHVGEGHCYTAN